jgi:hypothetical protein
MLVRWRRRRQRSRSTPAFTECARNDLMYYASGGDRPRVCDEDRLRDGGYDLFLLLADLALMTCSPKEERQPGARTR